MRAAAVGGLIQTAGGLVTPNTFSQARPTRGRIFIIHGLNTTAAIFANDPVFGYYVDRLAALDYDVIVPAVTGEGTGTSQASALQTQFNADATGANVRAQWLSDWASWTAGLPAAPRTILAAISWGSPMAAQIANNNPVDAMVVHAPVFPPNNLSEFSGYSLSALGNWNYTNLPSRMYVSYATDDARVASSGPATFVTAAGCQSKVYSSLGHSTTIAVVHDLVDWVKALPF